MCYIRVRNKHKQRGPGPPVTQSGRNQSDLTASDHERLKALYVSFRLPIVAGMAYQQSPSYQAQQQQAQAQQNDVVSGDDYRYALTNFVSSIRELSISTFDAVGSVL